MSRIGSHIILFIVAIFLVISCSTQKRLADIRHRNVGVTISLPESKIDESSFRDYTAIENTISEDTITVNIDGHEMVLMKAILDEESGEMVAHQELEAAYVTARFRNVAERNGYIDLEFELRVPKELIAQAWQLRFYPDMFIMQDSVRLDKVIVTGAGYRKEQLKGYERYNQFLNRIVSDSTKFIDIRNLEVFLKRHIPHIYKYKADSSFVSGAEFESCFGVSEQMAVEHYTNKFSKNLNKRRMERRSKMYSKYVKAPIIKHGVRLDTVIRDISGDLIYNYVQTVKTRKGLRKIDIYLSGEIFESNKKLYDIPRTEPLTFYISSLSSFTDKRPRYLKKVIERKATANAAWDIEFKVGKYDIDPLLGDNADQIENIKMNLDNLIEAEEFVLDSITIAAFASPEGSVAANNRLSSRRAESTAKYFNSYVKHKKDSLMAEAGMNIIIGDDMKESDMIKSDDIPSEITFISMNGGENWDYLNEIIDLSDIFSEEEKEDYFRCLEIENLDSREAKLRNYAFYNRMKKEIYPCLRKVRFDFFLHRKGMIKDTVHTTILDTTYMKGMQMLEDRDYEGALVMLDSYQDFNTAIAYLSLDRNISALNILEKLQRNAQVNYMLGLLYSRLGEEKKAIEHFLISCKQEPSYVHRGNLDPEISTLIKKYNLNKQFEDDYEYDI